MYFEHSPEIWTDFPTLAAGVLYAEPITDTASVDEAVATFSDAARGRLAGGSESDLPEIQAWRRTFAAMGLKPTQYRCAAESLLRRFRKEGSIPRIHPLMDACNAISMAFAIPVAVFDTAQVTDHLIVRRATGTETYVTFAGETEHPEPSEVIFADGAGQAHARRWCNRQSGRSAVRPDTRSVLIVAEALHASAAEDVRRLTEAIAGVLDTAWAAPAKSALLSPAAPRFAI
jgi:DNA/RNA-binding domain of Phe-tRNA-synthetase-like protein